MTASGVSRSYEKGGDDSTHAVSAFFTLARLYPDGRETDTRGAHQLIKAGLFEMIDEDDEVESGTGFKILLGADGKIAGFELAER